MYTNSLTIIIIICCYSLAFCSNINELKDKFKLTISKEKMKKLNNEEVKNLLRSLPLKKGVELYIKNTNIPIYLSKTVYAEYKNKLTHLNMKTAHMFFSEITSEKQAIELLDLFLKNYNIISSKSLYKQCIKELNKINPEWVKIKTPPFFGKKCKYISKDNAFYISYLYEKNGLIIAEKYKINKNCTIKLISKLLCIQGPKGRKGGIGISQNQYLFSNLIKKLTDTDKY